MKKKFIDKIMSKSFRRTAKNFIIWTVIFALFVFLFIKFVYYVKENMGYEYNNQKMDTNPMIKETTEDVIDSGNLRIKEEDIERNISVT